MHRIPLKFLNCGAIDIYTHARPLLRAQNYSGINIISSLKYESYEDREIRWDLQFHSPICKLAITSQSTALAIRRIGKPHQLFIIRK